MCRVLWYICFMDNYTSIDTHAANMVNEYIRQGLTRDEAIIAYNCSSFLAELSNVIRFQRNRAQLAQQEGGR